jgi:hypothetical protein
MRVSGLCLAAAVAAAAIPAFAGTVITSHMTGPNMANGQSVVYLDADRVRIESPSGVMIFRADQSTAYLLKPGEKTFMRMTPETMQKVAKAMDAARAALAERLKSMSPEQRAEVEKMMPGAGAAAAQPPKFAFRKAGGAATFGKWRCERVEQLMNGRPEARLCVTRLSELGISERDLAAMRRFETFMRQAAPQTAGATAAIDPQALEKIVGYAAFPVHSEIPDAKVETTTTSVEKKALPADLFEVPAGYREEAIPAPPR